MKRWTPPPALLFVVAYILLAALTALVVSALSLRSSIVALLIVPVAMCALIYPRRLYLWLAPIFVAGVLWDAAAERYLTVEAAADIAIVLALALGMCEVIYRLSTDRNLREQVIRQREEQFALAFSASPVAMLISRLDDGRIIDINDSFLKLIGYARAEVIGKTMLDLKTWPEPQALAETVERLRRDKVIDDWEYRIRTCSGEIREVVASLRLVDLGGQPSILTSTLDLTERKKAEDRIQELLQAEKSARQTTEVLHASSAALNRSLDLETILNTLLEYLQALVPYDSANVMLLDKNGRIRLHTLHGYEHFTDPESLRSLVIDPDDELPLKEILNLRSVLIPDTSAYPGWVQHAQTPYINSWMGVPLVSGGQLFGLFSVDKADRGYFTTEHLHLVEALAAQAAIAIKNARLVESERQQLRLAQTLQKVGALLTAEIGLDEALERIFDLLAETVPFSSVSVQLADELGNLHFAAGRGFANFDLLKRYTTHDEDRWKSSTTLEAGDGAVMIPDVTRLTDWLPVPGTEYIRSWIGVALRAKGRFVGVLNVDNSAPDAYDQQSVETVTAFANQAAIAIENARLSDATQRRNKYLTALRRVSRRSAPERDRDDFLQAVAEALADEFDYPVVEIAIGDDTTRELELVALAGQFSAGLGYAADYRQSYDEGVIGRVVRSGQPSLVRETQSDPDYLPPPSGVAEGCLLAVPLHQQDQVLGVISVSTLAPGALDNLDQEALVALADELVLNLENLGLYEQQVAVANENARLLRDSEERNRRLGILNAITRIGAGTSELADMLDVVAARVAGIIGGNGALIALWDPETRRTIPIAASLALREPYLAATFTPSSGTLAASVCDTEAPVAVEDVSGSRFADSAMLQTFQFESVLGLPLEAEGRILGALVLGFHSHHAFTPEEIEWARRAAELIALTMAKAQAYSLLEERVSRRTAELRAANESLTEMSRLKDEFVSNVSHELRTPIASIKLYHHLLMKRPEKQPAYLMHLNRETSRLERIVEDLLMLSRLDQDRIRFVVRPLDLNEIAAQYVMDRRALAEERGLSLTFKKRPRLPLVQGDPALLGQALSVILTNAMNYTPSGGQIRVATASRRRVDRRWVAISVKDSGPGIPPEEMPRLFQRFFRGKVGIDSGTPGTGLGLVIAREIVAEHGGHIDAVSSGKAGDGATFTIWLPITEGDAGDTP